MNNREDQLRESARLLLKSAGQLRELAVLAELLQQDISEAVVLVSSSDLPPEDTEPLLRMLDVATSQLPGTTKALQSMVASLKVQLTSKGTGS